MPRDGPESTAGALWGILKLFPSPGSSRPGKGRGWSDDLHSALLLILCDPVLLHVPAEEAAAPPGPCHLARSRNGLWMWQPRGVPGPLPLLLLPRPSCHEQSSSCHPHTRHPRVGRHTHVCSAALISSSFISSSFISSFTPPLPGASPSGRGPAQIPAWTRSLLSPTQRIWLVFPPKLPVSAGGTSSSSQQCQAAAGGA